MRYLAGILLCTLLYSCLTNTSDASKNKHPNLETNEPITYLNLGTYKGKIGTKLDVYFNIINNKNKISGFYFYTKKGIDIALIGTLKKDSLLLYELDFKKDTLALIKGKIKDSIIHGKWINLKNNKAYPLTITTVTEVIPPLPEDIEGLYKNEDCDLTLSLWKQKGAYFYKYSSPKRKLEGKIHFNRVYGLYMILENIEYYKDYFDVSLPEEDIELRKKYKKLQAVGKRQIGIEVSYRPNKLSIQNYGNSMNYYYKLYDCDQKFIDFQKQK